ncbi:PLDc_N domain-containing protein [Nocardioides anomalus]|uniref:PLDc_N domain-containing protein n=1 Tax=Nocardioides anomalus TaxID=2712223 RepID=A0A6G6WI89_9ACTN|nr:PLD nuclease N-terminal domain-containing protein [Nocardioides anomalus]QIG45051.1 PLDc_N domain-containing protein [Nocardioides anomalus]
MIKLELLVSVVAFAVWVFTLIDVAQTPENAVRALNKIAWLLIVFFFSVLGTIAWYAFGRPQGQTRRMGAWDREQPAFPEYDRPGRAAAVDPAKDEEFLAQVRARAEAQRKRHEEQKRREAGEAGEA